jgi:UDP-glucuronate decarboxylase
VAERVLVTGGAGFIGLHLVRRLLRDGAEVTVLDDFSRGRADADLHAVTDRVRLLRHDLTRPLPPDWFDVPFDAVYHLAAVVGVQRTTSDPEGVLRTNILATENLLRALAARPPGALFLSSTSEVGDGAARVGVAGYPTPEAVPFVLADPRSPRSAYALGKAVSESLVLHRAATTRVRVARYYNVYGPRMGYAHVIPQFVRRLLAGEDPFPVHGPDQTRAFCHVDDAVAATVALVRLPTPAPLVVNIGDDTEEISSADLARRLFRVAGASRSVDARPAPVGSPDRRLPDLTLLRDLLPARDPVPLDTGLAGMLEWYGADLAAAARRGAGGRAGDRGTAVPS